MSSYKYQISNGYLHFFPCILDNSWSLNVDIECDCGKYQNYAYGTKCVKCGIIHDDSNQIIYKISFLTTTIKDHKLIRLFYHNDISKPFHNILGYYKENKKLHAKAFEYLIKHIDDIFSEIEIHILTSNI